MSYLIKHKKSGLKIGNIVTIIRKCKNHEQGWEDSWNPNMDKCIGKKGKIINDDLKKGFVVSLENECWWFPYFVLNSRKDKIKKILE